MYDLRVKHPATWLIAGASGSGKTTLAIKILHARRELFTNYDCQNVVFFYNVWQPLYDDLTQEGIVDKWMNKCPSSEDLRLLADPFKDRGGTICIIDDFLNELNTEIVRLFQVDSHHSGCTIILLTQSIFPNVRCFRDLSLNCKIVTVLKNPRENQQFRNLARQISPANYKYIIDAYAECTKLPHSYICLDLQQQTPDFLRVRSNITPDEFPMRVWMEKSASI